jgi:hypothetical protein
MRILTLLLTLSLFFTGCEERVIEKTVYIENNETVDRLKEELLVYKNRAFEEEVDELFIEKYFPFKESGTLLDAQKSFVKTVFLEKRSSLRVDRVNPFNSYSEWYISVIQRDLSLYREGYKRALEEKLLGREDRGVLERYFGENNLKKVTELKRLAIANTMGNFYLDLNSSNYSDKKSRLYIDLKSDTTRFTKMVYIPMSEEVYSDLNRSQIKISVEWGVSIDMKSLDSVDIFIDGEYHRAEPVGARNYKIEL